MHTMKNFVFAVLGILVLLGLGMLAVSHWREQALQETLKQTWKTQRENCEDGNSTGDYPAANLQCEAALASLKQIEQGGRLDRAHILTALSKNHDQQSSFDKALAYGLESLQLQLPLGSDNEALLLQAETLNSLGRIYYHSTEEYGKALDYFQRASALWEKTLDPASAEIAAAANNVGAIYYSQNKFSEAEEQFKKSLRMREQLLGADHADVGESLLNLASTLENLHRYDEADLTWKRCIAIIEKLPPNHPDRVTPYLYAGEFLVQRGIKGGPARAETYLIKAVDAAKNTVGGPHARYARALESLASVYDEMRRPRDAREIRRRATQ